MRRVVDSEEAFGLDGSIALGRRQAGMTQQLLNCAQIAAGSEKMGCKAVPQGVRGGRFREAEKTSQRGHLALHDPWVERPAAAADKERAVLGQRERARGEVIGNRFAHGRQNRQQALLAALAGDCQHFAQRGFAPAQPERFGEPQPATIEKHQDRSIALAFPLPGCNLDSAVERARRILDRQRLRHAVRKFGRAQRGERRRGGKPPALQKAQEPSQHRKPTGEGGALDTVVRAAGQIGTEIAGPQRVDCRQARQFAQMLGQKVEEKGEIATVCGNRMGRGASLPREPSGP
jgi:hypothetical protein